MTYPVILPQMGNRTAELIDDELARAREKFPANAFGRAIMSLAALTEEVGELNKAMIDHYFGKETAANIRKEAIQVACMAIRVLQEGDAAFPYDPDSAE